jgi:hypothetical protein
MGDEKSPRVAVTSFMGGGMRPALKRG